MQEETAAYAEKIKLLLARNIEVLDAIAAAPVEEVAPVAETAAEPEPRKEEEAEKWDELEKSITAKLADEVKIFINGDAVEMVIEKTF